MSSTNRGYDRHKSDYYVTPQEEVEKFLAAWLSDLQRDGSWIGDSPDHATWLDPCAGGDENHEMSYPTVLKRYVGAEYLDTIDIREDSRAEIIEDYLETDMRVHYDVVITNPPFNQAQEIIDKALDGVRDGGYVVMLLRLNFFGSQKRFPFWQENMPDRCYVHHKRMSFTDGGGTDSIEYMHCVWKKGSHPRSCKLKVI